MLFMRDTRLNLTRHANVLPGVVIPEEGVALVYAKLNGETFVKPSAGGGDELFAGIAIERFLPPRRLPFVQQFEIGEDNTIALPRVPESGQISVIEGSAVRTVTAGDEAPSSDNAVLDGDSLLFKDGSAGRVVTVQMLYVPDVEEARALLGDAPFGGQASALVGSIGRILEGEIATSVFSPNYDWTNVLEVGLGADGQFIPAAGSNKVPGVVVRNSPNSASPYLALSLNVA